MSRPRVTNPAKPADQYSNKQRERIIEFYDPETDKGGLISFYRKDDGILRVDVYRCDEGVEVNYRPEKADPIKGAQYTRGVQS